MRETPQERRRFGGARSGKYGHRSSLFLRYTGKFQWRLPRTPSPFSNMDGRSLPTTTTRSPVPITIEAASSSVMRIGVAGGRPNRCSIPAGRLLARRAEIGGQGAPGSPCIKKTDTVSAMRYESAATPAECAGLLAMHELPLWPAHWPWRLASMASVDPLTFAYQWSRRYHRNVSSRETFIKAARGSGLVVSLHC
jgi:hypothetical protein